MSEPAGLEYWGGPFDGKPAKPVVQTYQPGLTALRRRYEDHPDGEYILTLHGSAPLRWVWQARETPDLGGQGNLYEPFNP